MGGQQDNSLQPFDEEWFDVANPCGKEFELPNASSPFNPRWSDNSNSLVFLQDQHLQSPDILENSYGLEIISPSCAENQVDCFPNMQMVSSIANSVPTVDSQEGSSIGKYNLISPRSTGLLKSEFEGSFSEVNQHVHVPTSARYSWTGLDINFSLRNQEFHFVNSTNSPSISSSDSLCLTNNPIHDPRFANTSVFGPNIYIPSNSQIAQFCDSPNAFQFNSDDYIINDHVCFSSSDSTNAFQLNSDDYIVNGHVCFSSSGCSSSLGSSSCLPVRNQEIRSSNFTDSPSFQNGSSILWNQVSYIPVMTNTSGAIADGDINHGLKAPNPLQNVSHSAGITSNVPIPVENQVGASIYAPRSNCHSSEKNKAFGPSSSKNGHFNANYTCKVCKREFPNYNAYGGHMSFHAKMKKAAEKMRR